MVLLFVYLFVAIGFSFYCSIAEAVLLSITPSFIATLAQRKPTDAARLESLKSNIDRPLAAILSLNTIAHTIGAAGVGAQAAVAMENVSVGVVSAVMTLLILIFSEIIPKTLGALYWRSLGPIVAQTVMVLIWVLYPLVWLSERLTKLLSGGKGHHTLTREELGAMAEIGAEQGVLEEGESRLFLSLMRFPEITVADIMTPRLVVIAFPESLTVGEVMEQQTELFVSRIPIYNGSLDHVVGFVMRSELLLAAAKDEDNVKLSELRRDMITMEGGTSAKAAFDQFIEARQHIALVTDQYGSTQGIVSLEDVIETLLGLEIVDEHDKSIDMQKVARKRWAARARKMGLQVPKGEE
ncbi:CNNM domain-containing protein [Rhodopirellula sp. MGV]|uniref:CNNM domain-containing protein n=1 Tax=Rhodopirellula sp. MGV TaxID=2023130 RepID=UPI000B9681BE|nr:hemolysin family protein [Rhodopirellula sp. MGV]OYP29454.1 hemolysin [Rhodopirellula sp. MGV]PNY35760.1 HlyC/CorC family transporter [Rhodopirellula baltica]